MISSVMMRMLSTVDCRAFRNKESSKSYKGAKTFNPIQSNPIQPNALDKLQSRKTSRNQEQPFTMNKLKNTIEQKLGDHPNVSANDSVNPDSGTGKDANQGDGESPLPTHLPSYHIELILTRRSA